MNESDQHDEFLTALYDVQLPSGLPIVPHYELAARFILPPAHTEPAGDWFDVVALSRDRVALVIGDVVGTGMEGAATTGQVRAVLRTALAHREDAVAALEFVDVFAGLSAEARGTTLVVAVLDPTSGSLAYCTAGHPPPLIIGRNGTARALEVTGSGPLGSGLPFKSAEYSLDPGELVVLHSSGLAGTVVGRLDGGSTTLLDRVVNDRASEQPVSDRPDPRASDVERVCEALVDLVSEAGGQVSVAVLAVQPRSRSLPILSIDLVAGSAAVRQARQALTSWLGEVTAAPMDVMAVVHAGAELVANSVEHAHTSPSSADPGTISVQAALSQNGEVTVEVRDRGVWRETSDDIARGRGLAMAAGLVDQLQVSADAQGTQTVLRHRLSRPVQILEGAAPDATDPATGLEVTRPAPGSVALSGDFGHDEVERVETDLLLASQGGTRDLTLDLSNVTYLSSAAARLLRDMADRYATSDWPSRVVFHAAEGSPVRSALELARLPYVATGARRP